MKAYRERARIWLRERMAHRYFVEADVVALATLLAAVRRETLEHAGDACAAVEAETPHDGCGSFGEGVRDGARQCLRRVAALRSTIAKQST